MTLARIACLVLALACGCGDDSAEIQRYSLGQAEYERRRVEIEAAVAQAEAAAIAADGKHWYDLPEAGQLAPGLHDCERYMAALRSYADCDKLPAATRDALRQSIDAVAASYRSAMSPDSARAANDGCRLGVEQMIDGALLSGCSLDIPP